jgi:branched-chain amino acid aminotransferase
MEFLEEQILSIAENNQVIDSARARITVYRNDGGYYLPKITQFRILFMQLV